MSHASRPKPIYAVVVGVLASFACAYAIGGEEVCQRRGGYSGLVCPVSMLTLIVRPEEYAGKDVSVIGYINGSGGDYFLFYDERSYLVGDLTSAIKIMPNSKDMVWKVQISTSRYNRVIGTFAVNKRKWYGINNPYLATFGEIHVTHIQGSNIPWGLTPSDIGRGDEIGVHGQKNAQEQ